MNGWVIPLLRIYQTDKFPRVDSVYRISLSLCDSCLFFLAGLSIAIAQAVAQWLEVRQSRQNEAITLKESTVFPVNIQSYTIINDYIPNTIHTVTYCYHSKFRIDPTALPLPDSGLFFSTPSCGVVSLPNLDHRNARDRCFLETLQWFGARRENFSADSAVQSIVS